MASWILSDLERAGAIRIDDGHVRPLMPA
jgi:hypothetical protein